MKNPQKSASALEKPILINFRKSMQTLQLPTLKLDPQYLVAFQQLKKMKCLHLPMSCLIAISNKEVKYKYHNNVKSGKVHL